MSNKEVQLYQPVVQLMNTLELGHVTSRAAALTKFNPKLATHEAASLTIYSLMTGLNPYNGECYYMPGHGVTIGIMGVRTKAREYNRIVRGEDAGYKVHFEPASTTEADFDPEAGDIAWKATVSDEIQTREWEKKLGEWIRTLMEAGLKGEECIKQAKLIVGPKPEFWAVGVVDHREKFSGKEVDEWGTSKSGKKYPKEFKKDKDGNEIYLPEMWDRNERAKKRAEKGALKQAYPTMLLPDMTMLSSENPQMIKIIEDVTSKMMEERTPDPDEAIRALTGGAVDGVARDPDPDPQENPLTERPWIPERIKKMVGTWADEYAKTQRGPINQKRVGPFVGNLDKLFGSKEYRYAVCKYLTGEASTKQIKPEYMRALWRWFDTDKDAETGEYIPREYVIREAKDLVAFVLKEQGQQELPGMEE